jgi:hypothetical protein
VVMNLNSYDIRDLYEVFFNCTTSVRCALSISTVMLALWLGISLGGMCWVFTTIGDCGVQDEEYRCMVELRKEVGLEGKSVFECFPKLDGNGEIKGQDGKMGVKGLMVASLAVAAVLGDI